MASVELRLQALRMAVMPLAVSQMAAPRLVEQSLVGTPSEAAISPGRQGRQRLAKASRARRMLELTEPRMAPPAPVAPVAPKAIPDSVLPALTVQSSSALTVFRLNMKRKPARRVTPTPAPRVALPETPQQARSILPWAGSVVPVGMAATALGVMPPRLQEAVLPVTVPGATVPLVLEEMRLAIPSEATPWVETPPRATQPAARRPLAMEALAVAPRVDQRLVATRPAP
jgi:hypothetical protein